MNEPTREAQDYSPVVFNGQTGAYFRIWIVNIALTLVTLGIYSAWATVRKRRYFYTNTSLASGAFDFHARPMAILIGRIIAVAMLAAYLLSGYLHPIAPLILIATIFLVSPLLIVRSRIFRMRNSSYRGIRFNFKASYADAFKVYYGSTLLTIVTLGLATGSAVFMRSRFSVVNSGFGQTPFQFKGKHIDYVSIFWKTVGLGMLAAFFGAIIIAVLTPLIGPIQPETAEDAAALNISGIILTLPLLALYMGVGVYYRVRLQNYMWNAAELGDNKFLSSMSVAGMVGIYLTNLLAIVFTFGLLIPWTQIRLARYRADHMQVLLTADWEKYIAADQSEGSALGDEIGEVFDVDVGIGF